MTDEMMHVKRIIRTTPLRTSLSRSVWPGDTSNPMPTMTMAMAPAAWAEVSPNMRSPHSRGILKNDVVA